MMDVFVIFVLFIQLFSFHGVQLRFNHVNKNTSRDHPACVLSPNRGAATHMIKQQCI